MSKLVPSKNRKSKYFGAAELRKRPRKDGQEFRPRKTLGDRERSLRARVLHLGAALPPALWISSWPLKSPISSPSPLSAVSLAFGHSLHLISLYMTFKVSLYVAF